MLRFGLLPNDEPTFTPTKKCSGSRQTELPYSKPSTCHGAAPATKFEKRSSSITYIRTRYLSAQAACASRRRCIHCGGNRRNKEYIRSGKYLRHLQEHDLTCSPREQFEQAYEAACLPLQARPSMHEKLALRGNTHAYGAKFENYRE